MAKRDYPLFVIDRDKLGDYKHIYITCLDKEVGFISKAIIEMDKSVADDYIEKALIYPDHEQKFIFIRLNKRVIILEIIDFLHPFEWSSDRKNRVRVLLKKALKKLVSSTFATEPSGNPEFSIDDQIKAHELTLSRAKQNWADLLKRGTEEDIVYSYRMNEAILSSLKKLKKLYELN